MKISHKRKVQQKLLKRLNLTKNKKPLLQVAQEVKQVVVEKAPTQKKVMTENLALTPKQQQVFDILSKHAEAMNPKSIGLAGGQEEGKAAAWATGALKKLVEENLVERLQEGNKVL